MINYEHIAAEAAELARLFWLEIEAEFDQQAALCQAGPLDDGASVADGLTIGYDSEYDIE